MNAVMTRIEHSPNHNANRTDTAEAGLVMMLAILVGDFYKVAPVALLDVPQPGEDRTSTRSRTRLKARTIVMSLLVTAMGWTQTRAAVAMGCVDRRAASEAVRRAADLRDQDAGLDALMDRIERCLSEARP
ncbi:hypothetical protein [Oceanicaulis sp. MMSF_3324]|uniref:hypothetical protein n=1 Tax=Oceanicaulis sp. MMSF_3324 TaxID=3046702 RepID=UPI0027401A1F|nr:hypothetical protein [Oceanicaulis sp. MMSF_3324]